MRGDIEPGAREFNAFSGNLEVGLAPDRGVVIAMNKHLDIRGRGPGRTRGKDLARAMARTIAVLALPRGQ